MATDWTTQHLTGTNVRRALTGNPALAAQVIDADVNSALDVQPLSVAITSLTVSGTPDNLQSLTVRIKDNGVAKALAFGAQFVALGVAIPTTTVAGKAHTLTFVYSSVSSLWGLVAAAVEA